MGCCCCSCASIETSIEISASPDKVYSILTDFDKYSDWNPFIIESKKDTIELIANKTVLTNKMLPNPESPNNTITFKPTVTIVNKDDEFEWLGTLLCRGCMDGRHNFKIESTDDNKTKVTLYQSEKFAGCLIISCFCCLNALLINDAKRNFTAMNEAIKKRAESM